MSQIMGLLNRAPMAQEKVMYSAQSGERSERQLRKFVGSQQPAVADCTYVSHRLIAFKT